MPGPFPFTALTNPRHIVLTAGPWGPRRESMQYTRGNAGCPARALRLPVLRATLTCACWMVAGVCGLSIAPAQGLPGRRMLQATCGSTTYDPGSEICCGGTVGNRATLGNTPACGLTAGLLRLLSAGQSAWRSACAAGTASARRLVSCCLLCGVQAAGPPHTM